jgi:CMP/dCMP kinase
MKTPIVIAIDGASSTGKSTLAKGLAKALDIAHVDSGAMYRGVTLYAQQQHWITETSFNTQALIDNLDDVQLMFKGARLLLNGNDISDAIRTMAVSKAVSRVAAVSEVRAFLVSQQRTIAAYQSVVMDGRDIGTVVFPNADLKLFLTADPNIRAKRRYEELVPIDATVTFEQVLENITQRDHLDSTRADSPLVQADDAVSIVASDYSIEGLLSYLLMLVNTRMK